MLVVEVGSVLTTFLAVHPPCSPGRSRSGCGSPSSSPTSPRRWPRAAARRRRRRCAGPGPTRRPGLAGWPLGDPVEALPRTAVAGAELQLGDHVVVEAGQIIPGDGDVVDGVASVDESAITGESAPVIRESGGDRSSVTGGTKVLSDRIVVRITSKPGETFIDRMIALVEGASRQKTPNEIALNILLASLTMIFLLAVVTLQPFAIFSGAKQPVIILVALLVCLIPTTIGALLSPSASPAWTGWCSATCWRCPAARSRPPATSTRCCSTRPAPSPRQPAGQRVLAVGSVSTPSSPRPSCPRSPTRRPRAARSSSSPSELRPGEKSGEPAGAGSCRSPPRPGCPASTSPAAAWCARAPPAR